MFPTKFPSIICNDNVKELQTWPDECVDLVVTSPPYDDLRTYQGCVWDFEGLAKELYRILKPTGAMAWIVGDQTKDGTESLSSFRQCLYLVDTTKFKLLDTMIYEKLNYPPRYNNIHRYTGAFEFMFVFTKSNVYTFNEIKDHKNKCAGRVQKESTQRKRDGTMKKLASHVYPEFSGRTNIWPYATGGGKSAKDTVAFDHPAIFPEDLARDHILSWSNPGDVVLDPFVGSGTVTKMAYYANRKAIGIDISSEYCAIARKRITQRRLDDVRLPPKKPQTVFDSLIKK